MHEPGSGRSGHGVDLWRHDASRLAQGYALDEFTPLEVLRSCIARAQHCQAPLNAMVAWNLEEAERAATASGDRWRRGAPLSELDGVPLTVKDNLHMAGVPTSWGSRLLQGYVPSSDELPVARARAGGAVLFGKTNLPEFAMQGHTGNEIFGNTRNPWNRALTPGGSSGGAAAAVASGCGPLALATDGGGSIRRPASHCGLVGFKPSAGLVPRRGGLPGIFLEFEVAGGMGRTVQDVRKLMSVLSGQDLALTTAEESRVLQARVVYMPRFGTHPVDAGIAQSVKQAASRLQDLGLQVDEGPSLPAFESINAIWPELSNAGLAWMAGKPGQWPEFRLRAGERLDLGLCGAAARESFDAGFAMKADDFFEVMDRVKSLAGQLEDCFSRHDFILTPATAALPWSVGQSHPPEINGTAAGPRGHAVFTAFANAAGLPAIALPTAPVNGLPVGLQLVGRKDADAALFALSQHYEAAHPWAGRRPPEACSEGASS
jgi:aspartyl-tRNA(Asn)/glutamyl-tRNA(Gln) amidotransferase subunit A